MKIYTRYIVRHWSETRKGWIRFLTQYEFIDDARIDAKRRKEMLSERKWQIVKMNITETIEEEL